MATIKVMWRRGMASLLLGWAVSSCAWAATSAPASVYLEDMTSPELRERIAQGATIALIPIGGTEQNGPVMTLGKHNARARALAGMIARQLGDAVVAPVISYVPEGSIRPPTAHMRFTGTISIPDSAFEGMLEGAARSLIQHGFRTVVFLGDHGGYQKSEARVAAKLSQPGAKLGSARVVALRTYYDVTQQGYVADLKAKGHGDAEIGSHAGLADTSLSLAVDPQSVRQEALRATRPWTPSEGVYGDPRHATADLGQMGVHRIVASSVEAIRELAGSH
ncbi:MAG TPA: creatininase family protein [Aquabacterium sp.]|nr:creatininase family protein [Aquabacterium sp.]